MGKATVITLSNEFLQYNSPLIEDDEINEVIDTLRSGWLTMGPKTLAFEKSVAEYTGARQAISCNSCTAALHLSLLATGIGPGDEVITTPYTFTSTANVIVHAGAKPVFADIRKDTFNIDPEKICEAITPKTKAIIPVDFGGLPCDLMEITEIAYEHDLYVFEDAAHSIGSEYDGKKIGTFADTTSFSFYPTKNITTGEGGIITTDDETIAERIRLLRLHGISKDAWNRYSKEGSWFYEVELCGWKYNMTDIQASLGIHQLKKLDRFYEIRKRYADIYSKFLSKIDGITPPQEWPRRKHVFHLYPIILHKYNRNRFIQKMAEKGIGCSVHFIPLHLQPYYQKAFGFSKGDFRNAEWVYEREVSLPLYPGMTQQSIHRVCDSIGEILNGG
jgi:dTDP-4-amino-4,6-dideoxygalactose transaminase